MNRWSTLSSDLKATVLGFIYDDYMRIQFFVKDLRKLSFPDSTCVEKFIRDGVLKGNRDDMIRKLIPNFLTLKDVRRYGLLSWACCNDFVHVFRDLVNLGCTIKDATRGGSCSAACFAFSKRRMNIIKILLNMGLRLNPLLHSCRGYDIVCWAFRFQDIRMVRILVSLGLTAKIARRFNNFILRASCRRNDAIERLKILFDLGLTVEDARAANNEALRLACERGNVEIAELLFEKGLTAEDARSLNNSALTLACKNGHINIVRLLVDKGLTVEDVRDNQNRALHLACLFGHFNIVRELVNVGLNSEDINSRNKLAQKCVSYEGVFGLREVYSELGLKISENCFETGHSRENPNYYKYQTKYDFLWYLRCV